MAVYLCITVKEYLEGLTKAKELHKYSSTNGDSATRLTTAKQFVFIAIIFI